jgi:hypothetical protein
MRKQIPGRELMLTLLCAGALLTTMTSGANPFHRQSERGTIETIDPQQHTLTVRDAHTGLLHAYTWNESTSFMHHPGVWSRSRTIGAADVKSGEHVNIFYKHDGDNWIAQKVVVTDNSHESIPRKGGVETQS